MCSISHTHTHGYCNKEEKIFFLASYWDFCSFLIVVCPWRLLCHSWYLVSLSSRSSAQVSSHTQLQKSGAVFWVSLLRPHPYAQRNATGPQQGHKRCFLGATLLCKQGKHVLPGPVLYEREDTVSGSKGVTTFIVCLNPCSFRMSFYVLSGTCPGSSFPALSTFSPGISSSSSVMSEGVAPTCLFQPDLGLSPWP